jgi:hypothetical protein
MMNIRNKLCLYSVESVYYRFVQLTIVISLALAWPAALQAQVNLTLEALPDGAKRLSWELAGDSGAEGAPYQLQKSVDLDSWETLVNLPLHRLSFEELPTEYVDAEPAAVVFYRLVRGGAVLASVVSAEDGADLYGFSDRFAQALGELGEISVEEFVERYGRTDYVEAIDYDPTSAEFWEQLNTPPGTPENPGEPQDVRLNDFRLNEEELAAFKKHGFVVSGRQGDHSFVDTYYKIFTADLPVFISLDSVLHAWHQGYRQILQEVESGSLLEIMRGVIGGMRAKLAEIEIVSGSGLAQSLQDADVYLTVADALIGVGVGGPSSPGVLFPENPRTILGQGDDEVVAILAAIESLAPASFSLFGRQGGEVVDFSQFKPRGHYTKSEPLKAYFQAMMWMGRTDFRVAGSPEFASPRELGTAMILSELLSKSEQTGNWEKADTVIRAFVGIPDSMTPLQLSSFLAANGIESVSDVTSLGELEALQRELEAGELGGQEIFSHGFFVLPGGAPTKLPRSFALFGQRFVMDSWALSNVVFDRIIRDGKKVVRRIPSGVDVAFSVLGNQVATPILAERIQSTNGVGFRDGSPVQHHFGALYDVFESMEASAWSDNIYTSWLNVLRQMSQPLGDSVPSVFRTEEWGRKTMSSQLASWTHLRHNTVLYVKQSGTGGALCSFPYSYVEPNLAAWQALATMAGSTADLLEELLGPEPFASIGKYAYLRNFQSTCDTLAGIVAKQLSQTPLDDSERGFLFNMVEIMVDYVGVRSFSGWYPRLYLPEGGPFWRSIPTPETHPSNIWDPVVTDVHTDFPSPLHGDPGTILHEAVGNTALMVVAVDCIAKRVYTGPVATYYEFTSGPGNFDRMTDEEWRERLQTNPPSLPSWTSGHQFEGEVEIPDYALKAIQQR